MPVPSHSNPALPANVSQMDVVPPAPLPYIATLVDAMRKHGFEPYSFDPPLRDGHWRQIWGTPKFISWIDQGLPGVTVQDPDDPEPAVQVYAKFKSFCDGRKMVYPIDLRCLRPITESIWELKTNDVRLFGWFPEINHLILHSGEDANVLHLGEGDEKWDPFIKDARSFLESLNEPLLTPITGTATGNVLSNRPR